MECHVWFFAKEAPRLALPILAGKYQHRRIHPEMGAETGVPETVRDNWVLRIQAPQVSGHMREALGEQAWCLRAQELPALTAPGAGEGEAQSEPVQAVLVGLVLVLQVAQ
jgi:hypothetical protein